MKTTPNILWIVADHQLHASRPAGFDAFPLQQKLARLGTEFNRAYSVLPICSPARASMLTGLYPHAHGLTENDGRFGGRKGLDPDDWMIHHALRDGGYRCGWFGKWHVDNRLSALDFGFEGFSLPGYGYPYSCDAYRDYLRRQNLDDPVARIVVRNESGHEPGTEIRLTGQTTWFDYVSGVAALEDSVEAHEAYFVSDLAARWLDSIGDDHFFVRVDPWGPHPPYLLAEPFIDSLVDTGIDLPANFHSDLQQRPDHHRRYRDFWTTSVGLDESNWQQLYRHALEHVILVETALSRLLDHVDLDNTLVIFNSDHGDAVGSNGGVANKGDLMVEATMQIPLLMAGPDIPAGQVCDRLVNQLDIVPTLLQRCGVETQQPLQGKSLAPLLQDPASPWRDGQMAQHYGLQEAILQRAWYRDHLKMVLHEDGFRELYDLASDPGELHNLALDPAYDSQLSAMQQELLLSMQSLADDNERMLNALRV